MLRGAVFWFLPNTGALCGTNEICLLSENAQCLVSPGDEDGVVMAREHQPLAGAVEGGAGGHEGLLPVTEALQRLACQVTQAQVPLSTSTDRTRFLNILFKGIVFKTMFSLLKTWAACPYMLSVSLIRCKYKALKKNCTSKAPLSASKKWKRQVTGFIILISPHRLLC